MIAYARRNPHDVIDMKARNHNIAHVLEGLQPRSIPVCSGAGVRPKVPPVQLAPEGSGIFQGSSQGSETFRGSCSWSTKVREGSGKFMRGQEMREGPGNFRSTSGVRFNKVGSTWQIKIRQVPTFQAPTFGKFSSLASWCVGKCHFKQIIPLFGDATKSLVFTSPYPMRTFFSVLQFLFSFFGIISFPFFPRDCSDRGGEFKTSPKIV